MLYSWKWFYKSFNLFLQRKDGLIDEIKNLGITGECRTINILVVGLLGPGKSSLVNTFITVSRNSGQLSSYAVSHPKYYRSTTKKVSIWKKYTCYCLIKLWLIFLSMFYLVLHFMSHWYLIYTIKMTNRFSLVRLWEYIINLSIYHLLPKIGIDKHKILKSQMINDLFIIKTKFVIAEKNNLTKYFD